MTGSAKQSIAPQKSWIASSVSLLAMTVTRTAGGQRRSSRCAPPSVYRVGRVGRSDTHPFLNGDGFREGLNPPTRPMILPDGQISDFAVQPRFQKYSASPLTQIKSRTPPSRPERGAYRDRHGRWVRDAVDAGGALDESR